LVSIVGLGLSGRAASAATIAQWNFDTLGPIAQFSTTPFNPNSPPATTDNTANNNNFGAPYATSLGMSNSYSFISSGSTIAVGSVPACDILSAAGVATGSNKTADAWRVRGPATNGYDVTSGTPTGTGNGWNLAALQYSQGVEFDADTTGYSKIAVTFDYFCTNQGVRDMQFQYTTNGTTWNNFGSTIISVPNDWYSANNIVEDLSGLTAVNNNPNFGVRMVSAYDSTGNVGNNYASATLASNGMTQLYNDNSGNWRFGTVTIETVPEPSTIALLAISAVAGAVYSFGRIRRAVC